MKYFLILMFIFNIKVYASTCDLKQTTTKNLDLSKVVLKQNSIQYGRIAEFTYRSTIDYDQRVLYYIPNSLAKNTIGASSVVFMHGGGGSTGGKPQGSFNIAKSYLKNLKTIAENQKTVFYMPVSPLNWGWNTMFVTKEIAQISSLYLKTDSNKSVLMGHSMGGMGIGRSSMYLVDHFAGLMPLSSGIQDKHLVPLRLKTYLNTAVRRQVGKNDHFDFFLTSSLKEEEYVNKIASDLMITDNHKTLVYNGSHNYELALVEKDLKNILNKHPRNLYQKRIFPVFYNSDRKLKIYQWDNLNLNNISRSFWLEAILFKKLTGEVASSISSADARVENNKYSINFIAKNHVKKLRVFISEKMVNMKKPIRIEINGRLVYDKIIPKNMAKSKQISSYMRDKSYLFENCVDLDL